MAHVQKMAESLARIGKHATIQALNLLGVFITHL